MQSVLSLHSLEAVEDLKTLSVHKDHYRGEWLFGFGWDQNKFSNKKFPTNADLDEVFPDIPVLFTRADGHAIWVNSVGLQRANIFASTVSVPGGEIIKDPNGNPTGILIDLACEMVQKYLPKPGPSEIENYLIKGMELFNQSGITHIRDLSCDERQWNVEESLDRNGRMTVAVEQFFDAFQPTQFSEALRLAKFARDQKSKNIRVKGIKVFYDGAIGSEGAFLSQPYLTRPHHSGLKLLDQKILKEMIIETWKNKFEIAIHVIGDQAAEDVVKSVTELKKQGHVGKLNLEHGELLNTETIHLMKALDVSCHIQPSHWLTDKHWLSQKIGDLSRLAFPWRKLEEENIQFDFGSDSPIEMPNFLRTIEAINDAEENNIPRPQKEVLSYHQHPDCDWVKNCYCVIEDGIVKETIFGGKIISNKG